MKPVHPTRVRILYAAAAALIFLVCAANFYEVMFVNALTNDQCEWRAVDDDPDTYIISRVIEGGVTDEAGVRENDTLVAINGTKLTQNVSGNALIHRMKAGETMTYTIRRGDSTFDLEVDVIKHLNFGFLIPFLLGFGFLFVGTVVVLAKPEGEVQRRFGTVSLLSMLFFGLASVSITLGEGRNFLDITFFSAVVLVRILAPVHFITFFCHFPTRKRIVDRRWFVPALYAVLVPLSLAPLAAFWFRDVVVHQPFPTILTVLSALPLICYGFGLAMFSHSYFARVERTARPKLRPIMISAILGGIGYIYILVVSTADPLAFIFYPAVIIPSIPIVAVPFAFGYSIVRYRLMDIQLIVKRSLIYGFITASVAAIYLLFVLGIGTVLGNLIGNSENELLTIIAIVVIAFAFDPMKRKAQEWVDKIFYRDRYNYQKALLEFSRELPTKIDMQQILDSIVTRIADTMHVEKVAVVLTAELGGKHATSAQMESSSCRLSDSPDGLLGYLQRTQTSVSLEIPAEERAHLPVAESDKACLLHSEIALVVPMLYKDTLIGAILSGAKLSDKVYTQDDIDLLSTVASQAAIALENARLYRDEVERQKIREELSIARRIQLGLLPHENPDLPGLEISGVSLPAESVGGDYFDYIRLDEKKLLVVVGDVSGKGIPAALYMSKIQGMVRVAAKRSESPAEILREVNSHIYERMEKNAFITMAVAVFDMETRTATLCRAGHTKPLARCNGVIGFLDSNGLAMGVEEGAKFDSALEELHCELHAGDFFVLYSDGLTESMNGAQEEFGEERLEQSVQQHHEAPLEMFRAGLIGDAERFTEAAPQHDDITLVVVKVNGEELRN